MTEPTAKHRKEARELVDDWLEKDFISALNVRDDRLVDRIATALSSRDREIREVLEGLASKHYVSFGEYCWCRAPGTATKPVGDYHLPACLAARGLWERVQGA